MPCFHPISAWRSASGVVFRPTVDASPFQLPCGRCIGCRLEKSRQWALRLTHEARFHDQTSFVTLTYKPEHLPPGGTLVLKDFQDFMKRLRKSCDKPLRFFHAGEYGERRGRPHYHAIFFGEDFADGAYDVETTDRGDRVWSSPLLDRLWPSGINRVGSLTFESCAYVARYVTKKISGPSARPHYERVDEATGEVFSLKPEYATMSRRPGIGALHAERYLSDIYPSDECVSRGHPSKPPKFYDKVLEKLDPELYALVKDDRECALAVSDKRDRTPRRLDDREFVKLAQLSSLKRRYEIG